ncbi:flavodoxin-dependent (E)-4-hydroxy-3-methylbut-2-enyl-diphosphate synthase [uncultured Dubosiella sp.]|uniref:flavodoxin-dependent (E)-4-hydroxy-3-methylbut-2-enyl-diphosphate synthase n=1 Tax=uncultured Dubosiella sp. TaxID=1937011 RepID=UPI00272F7394|nr:flavodoxin-dependent (E)-4-hydroxy-3-methylbut-2-enyl-diphosphate synthase [uncultured Dubosiella sp.]
MKYCKKCTMPDTRPGITFDAEGVCSACRHFEHRKQVDWDARWKEFEALCDKYRGSNGPGGYDCAVAVSGGKDSHFQVYVLKELMHMNPILFSVEDNFPMTEAGRHNLQNISEEFGCTIISCKPNIKAQKTLMRAFFEKYGKPTAEGMIESARRHVEILESLDFYDTVLSFKSSDPILCIEAYKLASETFDYPLHLGVTEAGTTMTSAIKSSLALGNLLLDGIGNTIRISVNGSPAKEIPIVKELLKDCKLLKNVPDLVACPTCGRTQWDMEPVVNWVEDYLQQINKTMTVAIMGCAVNGPGEAKHADIAIAGGKDEGLLIKKGQVIKKIPQDQMIAVLKEEIDKF